MSPAAWTTSGLAVFVAVRAGAAGVGSSTVDGALVTENRRADEKRRCVESLRARLAGARFAAYGNARSDFAHLQAVDEPVLVNAGAALRREAERLGIPSAEWRH